MAPQELPQDIVWILVVPVDHMPHPERTEVVHLSAATSDSEYLAAGAQSQLDQPLTDPTGRRMDEYPLPLPERTKDP